MKKIVWLGLLSVSLLVTGCQQKETKKIIEKEPIEIAYVKKVANEDEEDSTTFEYQFRLPEDYQTMVIKEREYIGNKLIDEKVITEEPLNKKTDTFVVSYLLENNEIEGLIGLPNSSNNMGAVGSTYKYQSMISYDVNENKVTKPEMDLLAARWKTAEESDHLESANMVFDETFNFEKDMTEDEHIVIWSCEFIK